MTLRSVCAAAAVVVAAGVAQAQFTAGNLVVSRVGDGSAALTSAATPVFLQEYTILGASVSGLAMPTVAAGSNRQFTVSGTATSEGFLTLSSDQRYLTIGGYDAAVGTASITSSASNTINRVVSRIDSQMIVDTTTTIADTASPGNIRSVCSADGSGFWVGTSAGGVRYVAYGTNASTQLNTAAPTNTRVTNIFGGQLYMSSSSGAFQGVGTLGSGLPTTAGQTPALLNGFPTATGPSSYDYFLSDPNTLYVADDRTNGSGGIQKWTQSAGTWSLAYTMAVNATTGMRGLCGSVGAGGAVTLYGTTAIAASNGNQLVSVTDLGAGSTFTVLATAGTNTAFRGVDFAPVPAPGTLGLLAMAGVIAGRRRR
jgi:hypothetical protein